MTVVSTVEMTDALERDSGLGEYDRGALPGFIHLLAEVVGDRVTAPVTMVSFMQVSGAFMGRLVNEGYCDGINPVVADAVRDKLVDYAMSFQGVADDADVAGFLARANIGSQGAFLDKGFRFGPDLAARVDAGTLTFGDLMRERPGVFIKYIT